MRVCNPINIDTSAERRGVVFDYRDLHCVRLGCVFLRDRGGDSFSFLLWG